MNERVIWLDAPLGTDVARVGNKTAHLGALAAEFPVPPGFCLTTSAYADWNAQSNKDELPPDLQTLVAQAYSELASRIGVAEPRVAVRSSGIDEDSHGSSFAGQYETILNISGIASLHKAIAHCWQSAASLRVQHYRNRQGHGDHEDQLAVLVQTMVPSDVSSVVFSVNPIQRDRNQIVINATWGLGESLVGGTVTPDTYIVDKANLNVLERTLAEKERMTVSTADGVREVPVPRPMRRKAALSDAQTQEMAALARTLENRLGKPVDLECAYHNGKLYLLQCRPVTTLDK